MKFTTPLSLENIFYLRIQTIALVGDEQFGLSVWRFYVGYYPGWGWCAGLLNSNGVLDTN